MAKNTKSLIARLEALEKQIPSGLTIFVGVGVDQKQMTIREFLDLHADQRDGMDLGAFRVTGNNLKQFDTLLSVLLGDTAVI